MRYRQFFEGLAMRYRQHRRSSDGEVRGGRCWSRHDTPGESAFSRRVSTGRWRFAGYDTSLFATSGRQDPRRTRGGEPGRSSGARSWHVGWPGTFEERGASHSPGGWLGSWRVAAPLGFGADVAVGLAAAASGRVVRVGGGLRPGGPKRGGRRKSPGWRWGFGPRRPAESAPRRDS